MNTYILAALAGLIGIGGTLKIADLAVAYHMKGKVKGPMDNVIERIQPLIKDQIDRMEKLTEVVDKYVEQHPNDDNFNEKYVRTLIASCWRPNLDTAEKYLHEVGALQEPLD